MFRDKSLELNPKIWTTVRTVDCFLWESEERPKYKRKKKKHFEVSGSSRKIISNKLSKIRTNMQFFIFYYFSLTTKKIFLSIYDNILENN